MDDVFDIIDEYEEKIEELEKLVANLRVEVTERRISRSYYSIYFGYY